DLADLPGVIGAELLTLADEQIRGSARKYAYAVLLELHDEAQALESLADRVPALPHLDPERWIAVVFRPIGHRVTTSEARRAGGGRTGMSWPPRTVPSGSPPRWPEAAAASYRAAGYWRDETLADVARRACREAPDRPLLIEGDRCLTRAEAWDAAGRLAAFF